MVSPKLQPSSEQMVISWGVQLSLISRTYATGTISKAPQKPKPYDLVQPLRLVLGKAVSRISPTIISLREHSSIVVQTAPLNFRALAAQSVRELTSISNNSYRSLAKTLNWQKVPKFDSCTYIWHGLLCDWRTYYEDLGGFKRCRSTENHAKSNNSLQKLISIYT